MLVQRELTPIVDSDGEVHGEVVSIAVSASAQMTRHASALIGEPPPVPVSPVPRLPAQIEAPLPLLTQRDTDPLPGLTVGLQKQDRFV